MKGGRLVAAKFCVRAGQIHPAEAQPYLVSSRKLRALGVYSHELVAKLAIRGRRWAPRRSRL